MRAGRELKIKIQVYVRFYKLSRLRLGPINLTYKLDLVFLGLNGLNNHLSKTNRTLTGLRNRNFINKRTEILFISLTHLIAKLSKKRSCFVRRTFNSGGHG